MLKKLLKSSLAVALGVVTTVAVAAIVVRQYIDIWRT